MLRALRFGVATSLFLLSAVGARAADDVMVVFDGSNSMWGQIGGVPKIEIARKAMSSLLGDWTKDTNIGLMAYGHRREGDCTDIETLIQPGPLNRAAFMSTVNGITPRGRTPLTSAVEMAAKVLSYRDNPATVVLISDGIESCDRDPCALADTLEKTGVRFTAHVVGFGLGGGDQRSLACIAEKTGGKFLTAANAGELNSALREVGSQVTKAAPPEPAPVPDVRLTAPETVEAGSGFQVGWTPTVNADDVITMVPADAPADRTGPTVRAGSGSPAQVQAPDAAGMFQLRYILADGGQVLARAPVQVTKAPEVALSVPATVETGADFQAGWDKTIAARDLVTIVPMGAKPNEIGAYKRAESGNPATLRAPSDPGLYEVRYVLDDGRRIAGRARVEVTEPQVRVDGPDSVLAGSDFEMSWDKTINKRDLLTIAPMGADEDEIGDHKRASDGSPVTLRAPSQPGMYQLRYVLDEGRRVMASKQIEITEGSVQVNGPDSVLAGSDFEMSWDKTINKRDILTIVPMGADEDEIG
ncbi:MAG: VWA domain-containing protein, partial [Paracoccaceae bacterium]